MSTLELMLAFTILSLTLGAVALTQSSNDYWVISTQTSAHALGLAKTALEKVRTQATANFLSVQPLTITQASDDSCNRGGLCYFLATEINRISNCAAYARATVSWQTPGHPTTTSVLATPLTDLTEVSKRGGNCLIDQSERSFSNHAAWQTLQAQTVQAGNITPNAIAMFGNVAFIAGTPTLTIVATSSVSYVSVGAPANAVAVARDLATGRLYAYMALAAATNQLAVFDVTDLDHPQLSALRSLAGVSPFGRAPQGWTVAYYGQMLYLATRYTTGPELHIFDVCVPASPLEIASSAIDTSAYAMAVRDQVSSGAPCVLHGGVCRFLYLATTSSWGRVRIYDVTDPRAIVNVASRYLIPYDNGCSRSGQPAAKQLSLLGTTLFVGLDKPHCAQLDNLWAFDVSEPYASVSTLAHAQTGESITGLVASDNSLFVENHPAQTPSLIGLDVAYDETTDQTKIFSVANASGQSVQVWQAVASSLVPVSSVALTSDPLQVVTMQ